MELIIKDLDELELAVAKLLDFANGRKKILFTGEIGAGKTTFIKYFCQHFQVQEHVTSPTFSLINEYEYEENAQIKLIHHLDLYRLKSAQEALDIGIEDYLFDEDYCLIEWPEIIESLLPDDVVRINIELQPDSSRKMLIL